MDDDQAREEVDKWSNETAQSFEQLVQTDEGRFQLLYSTFGAVAFAVTLFLLNAVVTAPATTANLHPPLNAAIVGICANALAAGLSFFRPMRFLFASAGAFFVGAGATVIAVYLLLQPFDDTTAKLFLVMSIVVVGILVIALLHGMASTVKSGQQLMRRITEKPPKQKPDA
jgi:uncharacterized membrane protein